MVAPLNNASPVVPPIEDAKQGIQTFAMFYYQSLLDAGFGVNDAKRHVAELLEKQHAFFCEQGKVERPSLSTAEKKLQKSLDVIKEFAKQHPELRTVYNDLLSIQSQTKR